MQRAGVLAVAALTAALAVRIDWDVPGTLWLDDAWLALATRADGLGDTAMVGVTAPGFAVLLRLVHGATGWVEELVRVAAVAALAVPAAVAVVARRSMRLGWGSTILAAGIVAACPALATYAWRVKPFALDALLAAGILAAACRVLRGPEDRRRWVAFAAVALACLALSAATAMTSIGCGAVLLVVARHQVRRLLPVLVPAAVAAAAWWAAVLRPASTPALHDYWADHDRLSRAPDAAEALLPVAGWAALVLLAATAAIAVGRDAPLGLLLLAPAVVAAAAGAAGLAPFGGGRTDLHLLPSVAILVAAALDALPAATGPVLAAGALVLAPAAEPYPVEDLGPLVAVVDTEAGADDAVLVYSAARWAYALETDGDIDLVRDERSANGFDARPAAATVLQPGAQTPIDADGDVWLLVSHGGDDVARIRSEIAAAGFAVVETHTRPGADLTKWHREGR